MSLIHCLVLAQNGADAAGVTESSVAVDSLWDFAVKGGPMMIPIGICSLIALAVVVERLIIVRRERVAPSGLVRQLGEDIDNNEFDEARKRCEAGDSPLARVCHVGLSRAGRPLEFVEKGMMAAGEDEVFVLRKRLRALAVIASVTPLMGLVGTILGMIRAFQTVAVSAEALGRTEMLAGGIYEAMITTAAGLIVAIPTLIAFHWISSRIDRYVREIDRVAVRIAEGVSVIGPTKGSSSVPPAPRPNGAVTREPAPKPVSLEVAAAEGGGGC
ncbi:MAG: MotA/TolQ/ExbB proton channel family protein [Phycisphaerales bacterium]